MLDTKVAVTKCDSVIPRHCVVIHDGEVVYDGGLIDLLDEYSRLSKKQGCIICLSSSDYDSFSTWMNSKSRPS